ncbi:MAG: transposase [Chthonomonadaceae bacterium]|nr:transposase [Chthonomonadaceae bacterium]
MNRKTFKYRLYPTSAQETTLRQTLETCRGVYNSLLNERKHDYEICGKSPSCAVQQKHLPVWKQVHPELCGVFSQVLQDVAKRIEKAFEAFFRRVALGEEPGYPRFKGKNQYKSLTYPQMGFAIGENCIHLSKIGTLKAVLHRPVEGTVKTCIVKREGDKWFVTFSCEILCAAAKDLGCPEGASYEVEADPLPPSEEQVGIDVGLKTFAALSNGEFIDNPRFYRKEEKALAKAERNASRGSEAFGVPEGLPVKFDKVKNKHKSKARRTAKKVVRRVHERIKNHRHDFIHQTARRLVNRFGLIAVEQLSIENMMATPQAKPDPENEGQFLPNGAAAKSGLNKSIADAGWGMFRYVLTYKAESAGRVVVNVNPAFTSQDCSGCGYRPEKGERKTLSDRIHFCPRCGLVLDRDTNSARTLLQIAVGQYSVPAETE